MLKGCTLYNLFTFLNMDYIQLSISIRDTSLQELLIALLSDIGFEGFEEREEQLLAFIPQQDFDESAVLQILMQFELPFTTNGIKKTNWNQEWERNFQPVTVDDFCTVRADFHELELATEHEIVIMPKMSFGTGHHATTQLMIRMMRKLDFRDKKVFDFGTGTGILAILASRLGANRVFALDNESWAYENAIENAKKNGVDEAVDVLLGSLENMKLEEFDIILANINRHILLQHMFGMYQKLKLGGTLIMSGLLNMDEERIISATENVGFRIVDKLEENSWIALWVIK